MCVCGGGVTAGIVAVYRVGAVTDSFFNSLKENSLAHSVHFQF